MVWVRGLGCWGVVSGGGGGGEDGGGVHKFFEVFGGVVFELLEIEVGFVADGDAVSDCVCGFGDVVTGFDEVVGHVYGFVVGSLDDFSVEGKGGEYDFEADDVAFAERGVGEHKVFGPGHVHLLSCNVAETIAVGVEADRCVETGFTAGPAYTHVTSVVFLVTRRVVWGFYSAEDFAFPVPASLANADICTSHTEPLFCGDASAGKVEEDVRGGIFEVEAGTIRFCF